jgi:hypothetical protein
LESAKGVQVRSEFSRLIAAVLNAELEEAFTGRVRASKRATRCDALPARRLIENGKEG